MQLEVGKILQGKVTGITKFGAFVELEDKQVGMVHISEVSQTYIDDISEHLKEGQEVKVKVLTIGEDGKVSLSIKKAMKPAPRENNGAKGEFKRGNGQNTRRQFGDRDQKTLNRPTGSFNPKATQQKSNISFEDMLSKFMSSSDEKLSDIKRSREVNRRAPGAKRR